MRGCRLHCVSAVPRTPSPCTLLRERFRRESDRARGVLRSTLQNWPHGQRKRGPRKLPQHPVVRETNIEDVFTSLSTTILKYGDVWWKHKDTHEADQCSIPNSQF